jgi:hypothetical protein
MRPLIIEGLEARREPTVDLLRKTLREVDPDDDSLGCGAFMCL